MKKVKLPKSGKTATFDLKKGDFCIKLHSCLSFNFNVWIDDDPDFDYSWINSPIETLDRIALEAIAECRDKNSTIQNYIATSGGESIHDEDMSDCSFDVLQRAKVDTANTPYFEITITV